MTEKDRKIRGLIGGITIAVGLPLFGYIFGGWKWAVFCFLIPQMILIIIKSGGGR